MSSLKYQVHDENSQVSHNSPSLFYFHMDIGSS